MGAYVASQLVKAMLKRRLQIDGARVLILGLTFKENCPDLRNTRVVDVVAELRDYGVQVDVHDPWVDHNEAEHEYGLDLVTTPEPSAYDGVILAVAHDSYRDAGATALRGYGARDHVFCDLKSIFSHNESDLRL
jgi:UDP-N-acetyl-D-galactosamine dehydrogenase